MPHPHYLHIVGRKNSGKTTLIVDLVSHLRSQGMVIGTIKHTHHHHDLDMPGKDSYRHRQAGAAMAGIMTPDSNALFWPAGESDHDERYAQMMTFYSHCDLVLIEGHLTSSGLKIEVWRAELGVEPLAAGDRSIVAVVSDDAPPVDVPVWSRRRPAELAERVVQLVSLE